MDEHEAASAETILAEMDEQEIAALQTYVLGEPEDVLRLRGNAQPEFPWPTQDNPMLAYLVRRSSVLAASDGTGNALVWLGVHAWFEGALAGRSTLSTDGPSQDREAVLEVLRQHGIGEQQAAALADAVSEDRAARRRRMITGEPAV
jgi:hypothetical protein